MRLGKVYRKVLTFVSAPGVMISSIGSTLLAFNKLFTHYGASPDSGGAIVVKTLAAGCDTMTMVLTRLPAIWSDKYNNQPWEDEGPESQDWFPKISDWIFGLGMGTLSTVIFFMNTYLSGEVILDEFDLEHNGWVKVFGIYVAISNVISYAYYSVEKTRINARSAATVLQKSCRDREVTISSIGGITLGITSVALATSCTMFFFAEQNAIPMFAADLLDIRGISDEVVNTFAGILIIPAAVTLILSEPASVYKCLTHSAEKRIEPSYLNDRDRRYIYLLYVLNIGSVVAHSVLYYEYMSNLLRTLAGSSQFVLSPAVEVVLSLANGASAGAMYWFFNGREAVLNAYKERVEGSNTLPILAPDLRQKADLGRGLPHPSPNLDSEEV